MWEKVKSCRFLWRSYISACLAAVAMLCAPSAALAQDAGDSRVIILQPFTVVNIQDLNFGNIIAGDTPGTVTVNVINGVRSSTGGTLLQGNSSTRARFRMLGQTNQVVRITIPASTVLTHSNGSDTMNVDQMGINFGTRNFGQRILGRFTGNFVADFNVGGRLNVGANQRPGRYTGSFVMTVDFL